MKFIYLSLLSLVAVTGSSCSGTGNISSSKPELANDMTFMITEVSADETYGYSEKNPIKVGGDKESEGPKNERRYLNALQGPRGEAISYLRAGSCCEFKSRNGFLGMGLLDMYEVTWVGSPDTLTLYINMYDAGPLKAPAGFSTRFASSDR